MFSLKALSNNNFIHIEDLNDHNKPLKANTQVAYENTAFEAVIYPGSQEKEDEFIISLRSMINGQLVSAKNEKLFASAVNLSDNEKFYVQYSFNNVIGRLFLDKILE